MHSKFFKQIYSNELDANFSSIETNKASNIFNKLNVDSRLSNNESLSDSELETLLEESRRNPYRKFSKEEAALLTKEKELLDKEVDTALKEISNLRNNISEEVSASNDAFVLSLNESQRIAAIEVFGEEKTEITYEDYTTLLELKKLLDIDETFDLLTEAT